mmetsp:Transcript_18277/g.46812  ORF Transcript_18277/g.46812 Transcript_18277/m.46812 type:complete len:287 (+) Transcript_18277:73-933(+)
MEKIGPSGSQSEASRFQRSMSTIQATKKHMEISGPAAHFRDVVVQAQRRETQLTASQLTPAVKDAAINVVRELQQLQDEYIKENPGVLKPRSEFIKAPWGQLSQLNKLNDLQRQQRGSEGAKQAGTWKHVPIQGFETQTEMASAHLLLMRNRLMPQEDARRRHVSNMQYDRAARVVQRVWAHYKIRKVIKAAIKSKWRLLKRLVSQEVHLSAEEDMQERWKLGMRERNLERKMSKASYDSMSIGRSNSMAPGPLSRNMSRRGPTGLSLPPLCPFSSEPPSVGAVSP